MLSAARVTTTDASDECPPPGDEPALVQWVHRQRERQVAWAEVTRAATEKGHTLSEGALCSRYRRWCERGDQGDGDTSPTA